MEFCIHSSTIPLPSNSTKILNFQSVSSSVGTRSSRSTFRPRVLSTPLSTPFLQVIDRFLYQQKISYLPLRTFKKPISAETGKQGWDFGRFFKTLYFFNRPPSLVKCFEALIAKLSGPSPSEPAMPIDTEIVLVAGGTGGVRKMNGGHLTHERAAC